MIFKIKLNTFHTADLKNIGEGESAMLCQILNVYQLKSNNTDFIAWLINKNTFFQGTEHFSEFF